MKKVAIIISWNIRGIRKLEKRAAVRKLIRNQKVSLLMLQETRISKDIEHIIPEK